MARLRLLLLVGLLAWMATGLAVAEDKGVLASLISRLLSSRATQVSIGSVEGAFSSDATVRDIVLSDRDGPWLKIDRARLIWTRSALLARRLEVDKLEIGDIEYLRAPLKGPPDPTVSAEPLLPDLPLKVIVKTFDIGQLGLGPSILGTAARLTFHGAASLGPPSEGLNLDLSGRRLDAPGDFLVKLAFAPQTTKLSLHWDAREPAGGLFATLANLPGVPATRLSFKGEGPLDAFHADLDFAAGAEIGAKGAVDLERQGAGRVLTLDMQSRLSGLVPALIAPVFQGVTALRGEMVLADDGAFAIHTLRLASETAALRIEGEVRASGEADLTLAAGEAPGARALGKLVIEARLRGPIARPDISAKVEIEDLRSQVGRVGAIAATVGANAIKGVDGAPADYEISADASFSRLALTDAARQAAIGAAGSVTLRAKSTPSGGLDIAELRLKGESLEAAFVGEAALRRLRGRLSVDAPDLSRFAALSSLALRGAAHAVADIEGSPERGDYMTRLSAKTKGFATGAQLVDGFAGSNLAIEGGLSAKGDGGFGFDKFSVAGAHGVARFDGGVSRAKADLQASLETPDAKFLDPRVSGAIKIVGELTGSLTRLNGAMIASLPEGRLLERPAKGLELRLAARDLTDALDASAELSGEIDSKPLTGALRVSRQAGGGWRLENVAFASGSARLSGALALAPSNLADGRLTLEVGDLDDLSALALTPLQGPLRADIRLRSEAGRQSASMSASSARARFGAGEVVKLAIEMQATDLLGRLLVDGSAAASRISLGGESVIEPRLTAKAGTEASDFDFSATARGLAWRARGQWFAQAARLRLGQLTGRGKEARIELSKPADLTFSGGRVAVDELVLTANGGKIALSGGLGSEIDIRVSANAAPLKLAELASPGLGLEGLIGGQASLTGPPSAPRGDWNIKIEGLSAPATRGAGLVPLSVIASGRIAEGRSSFEATVNAAKAGTAHLSGFAPLAASGALEMKANGRLDLAIANRALSAQGQRLSGALAFDGALSGDIGHPRAQGAAKILGATFTDEARGLKLTSIEAVLSARGDEVELSKFRAGTPNGGQISAEGRARLDPAAGFPGSFRFTGQNAELVATDIVTANASFALDVTGALARAPRISGRIDLDRMDINIPGRLAGAAQPLEGAKHIDPGETARLRLAMVAKAAAVAKSASPFNAALDLKVSAPSRIFLRGRGVDAEFGGNLGIGGATNAPRISGGFDLRRGVLGLLGTQLTFSRGRVDFRGDVMPELDLTAQTSAADITAIVNVTGPAAKPVFAFTSNPTLPQDEILSRMLFQKASGNLSAFQALQLANAVASLTGNGDAYEKLRKSLGVDSLDVSTSSTGGPVVGARRAINDRLSVGVKSGARPEDNGVTLDLDVTRHFRLQGGVDAKGGSTVGAGTQWEY